ncbi:MAG: ExeM/NucH family extracellular endonuclease, partial [Meiothermus silvanus]|nr:ExeM/NucH family extracellular endonuclease [Allomeiothermus silvanus]
SLLAEGVAVVGGCCGTRPTHTRAIAAAVADAPSVRARAARVEVPAPSSTSGSPAAVSGSPIAAPVSELAAALARERFVVAVEMEPPRSTNAAALVAAAETLRDAGAAVIDVADSPMARMRMSAWAACRLIQERAGIETVLHFPTRGRNLLRLQGDLLGAHALGIRNLFVCLGDPVTIGDHPRALNDVDVTATGLLALVTQGLNAGVDRSGASIGEPTAFFPGAAVAPSTGDLERYEGMLVSFPQTLTVSEVYNLGRFGEISLSAGGRLFHPNNGNGLGDTAMGNPLRRILLDDGSNVQNPRPIPYLSAADTSGTRRVGDSVVGLTGVLSYGFSSYRVEPVGTVNFIPSNPRPEAPEDVGGSLRVASYNVLNYFTTLGARGASNQAELERQRAKLVAALRALDADIVGLIEIQNNGDAALEDLVRALNTALGSDAYTALATGSLGTDQIKVALIYKPARVRPEGAFRIDDDPIYSRPPLAQTFRDRATGGRFSVVVNHFKSKGCEGASGAETDTGQGCWNALRVRQAQRLLTFINDLRATDPDVLVVGDLNAYAEEDPLKVLTGAGLENLILHISAAKRYSYVFNGESGNLDHALATSSLSSQVTGITEWHINADEP